MTASTEPTAARTDVVFVPGSGCDHRLFAAQTTALADQYRVHVVNTTTHPRIETLAAYLLAQLPEEFVLAGLSQGGLIALEMIRQAPHRVTALILMDTLSEPGLRADAVRHRLAIGMLKAGMFGPIEKIMWPRYVDKDRVGDIELRTLVAQMMRDTTGPGLINQQYIFIHRPDYRPVLPTIAVPALVIVGDGDTLSPVASVTETAAAIPGSRLVVISDAGHLTPLERPDQVTSTILRFLNDHAAATGHAA